MVKRKGEGVRMGKGWVCRFSGGAGACRGVVVGGAIVLNLNAPGVVPNLCAEKFS